MEYLIVLAGADQFDWFERQGETMIDKEDHNHGMSTNNESDKRELPERVIICC